MPYVQDANDPNALATGPGIPGGNAENPAGSAAPPLQPQTSSAAGGDTRAVGVIPAAGSPQGVRASVGSSKTPPVQDLKAYLEANQPAAVKMGQDVAGGLDTQYSTAQGTVDTGAKAVGDTVAGMNVAPDAELVGRAADNPGAFVENASFTNGDQPGYVNPNAGDVAAFKKQRDAAYTGPTSFESTPEYQAANQSVTDTMGGVPDINAPGGVRRLVTGLETNPTAGMENLDTLMLGGTPGAIAPINASIGKIKTLGDYLKGQTATQDAAIKEAQANDLAASGAVTDKFLTGTGAVAPAFQQAMKDELAAKTASGNKYNADLNTLTTTENENPELAALRAAAENWNTGIDPQSRPAVPYRNASGLPGFTIEDLQPTPNPVGMPTMASAATSADVSKEKALEALLEGRYNPSFDPTTGVAPWQDPGAAPTFQEQVDPMLQSLQQQYAEIGGARSGPGNTGSNRVNLYNLAPQFQPTGAAGNALEAYLNEAQGFNALPPGYGVPAAPPGAADTLKNLPDGSATTLPVGTVVSTQPPALAGKGLGIPSSKYVGPDGKVHSAF